MSGDEASARARPSTSRRRAIGAAVAVAVAAAGVWLARYTVLLDFPLYVEALQAEQHAELLAAMDQAVEDIMAGDGEGAVERAESLRDRDPDWDEGRLSDEDAADIAERFAAVDLYDPAREAFAVVSLAALERDADTQCHAALDRLRARAGAHARVVLWLNGHRCDELVGHWRARLRPEAERQAARLTPAQREAIEEVARRYGSAVRGAILRVHRQLGPERARASHRAIADDLAREPPQPSWDDVAERLLALEDDHDLGGCTLSHEVEADRFVVLALSCLDVLADEPDEEPTLYVDLDQGTVSETPPVGMTAPWGSEGEAAIDELATRLLEAATDGELPNDDAAAPLLQEAMDRSGCIIRYEPLGYYEEADLRVICQTQRFVRHIQAAPDPQEPRGHSPGG